MPAILYRMGAAFPGDITRIENTAVEPVKLSSTTPPLLAGQACLYDPATDSVRAMASGDTAVTSIAGVTVRAFPFQQTSGQAAAFGTAGLTPTIADIVKRGYIAVQLPAGTVVRKGDPVFIWVAASSGNHVQGGFEGAASGGNTAALSASSYFNGEADANGVAELAFRMS